MASTVASDLLKTLKSTFGIKLATITAAGLTAARTYTLPDRSITVAGTDEVATAGQSIGKINAIYMGMAMP